MDIDLITDNHIFKKEIKLLKKLNNTRSIFSFLKNSMPELKSYFNIIFLDDIFKYYKIANRIRANKKDIIRLYKELGYIDALISISFIRESFEYSKPEFVDRKNYLLMEEAYNPILKNPVPNSITIKNKNIMITGTNMSGKTTFLRTVGINSLLSQTIYTNFTGKYKSSFFDLISSINIEDNIVEGKSYYYMEAERINEILEKSKSNISTLILIDEIFKGTNYGERKKASLAVINYLLDKNCLLMLTTHDLELEEDIKNNFDYYHFSESIEDSDYYFDYKLKEGRCEFTNAIKLLERMDFPEEIINFD